APRYVAIVSTASSTATTANSGSPIRGSDHGQAGSAANSNGIREHLGNGGNDLSLPTPRRSREGHTYGMKLHFFQRSDGRTYKSAWAAADVSNPFPTIYSQLPLRLAADPPADEWPLAHGLLCVTASGH